MTVYLEGAKTFHLVTLTEKPKQNDLLLRRWNLQSSTRISFMKVPFLGKIRVAIKAAPPDSTKIASRHQTNKQIGTQHIRNEHYRVSPKHERHLEICLYLDTSNRNSNQPSTIS